MSRELIKLCWIGCSRFNVSFNSSNQQSTQGTTQAEVLHNLWSSLVRYRPIIQKRLMILEWRNIVEPDAWNYCRSLGDEISVFSVVICLKYLRKPNREFCVYSCCKLIPNFNAYLPSINVRWWLLTYDPHAFGLTHVWTIPYTTTFHVNHWCFIASCFAAKILFDCKHVECDVNHAT